MVLHACWSHHASMTEVEFLFEKSHKRVLNTSQAHPKRCTPLRNLPNHIPSASQLVPKSYLGINSQSCLPNKSQEVPRRPIIQERHSLGPSQKSDQCHTLVQNISQRYPNLHPNNSHNFLPFCNIPKHSSRLISQSSLKDLLPSPNSSPTMSHNPILGTLWDDLGTISLY